MNAVQFEAKVNEDGRIMIPAEVVADIPAGQQVRVVVMWDVSGADAAWREAGRRSFEAAYSEEDGVYDELTDDPSSR
jgi:hypothetical protein